MIVLSIQFEFMLRNANFLAVVHISLKPAFVNTGILLSEQVVI